VSYAVKEVYYTLQGEGLQTGRAAVFLRFAGCNLWSGREEGRASATCRFCDTDFVGVDGPGGGRFGDAASLAAAVRGAWEAPLPERGRPLVVCTGGEPLLQLDAALVEALHAEGFEVAVETNGTRTPPPGLDWITVSPKAGTELAVKAGDELKLVFPQSGAEPELYEQLAFRAFVLQPMDGATRDRNVAAAAAYCLAHPLWRLGLQSHKLVGLR